jgi:pyruvate dehydrogenase E2 component (dihydrolipoamide acetyltransferase)
MPKIMNMPKIGVNMTDATIVAWVAKEGQEIKEGDHILDAETDKAVQEIYATDSGILGKILVPQGETVLCQQPIAVLTEHGEEISREFLAKYKDGPSNVADEMKPSEKKQADSKEDKEAETQDYKDAYKAGTANGRIRISPLAKKMAKDMGIDLKSISPSKPGTRIVKEDVQAYVHDMKSSSAANAPGRAAGVVPYSGTRKVIGDRMLQSSSTKPAAALTLHADAEMLIKWRNKLKKEGKAVSYNDLLVQITARALREYPIMNSRLEGNEIKMLEDINIGVAVDTDKGLMVPVIRNADRKGVLEISEESKGMLERIRKGKGALADMTGGTLTITNLGMFEIEQFTPIINPPECCILAAGAIVREPVVDENDNIKAASRMQLTLVFDHRIVDGAPGARFLQRVKHLIEWPMGLME